MAERQVWFRRRTGHCLRKVTCVITTRPGFIDDDQTGTYSAERRSFVKDIHEVLRKKQAEQAQLGKQIEALQNAAEQLRNVAHLLNAEEEDEKGLASHA